jgi:hypothetical protein
MKPSNANKKASTSSIKAARGESGGYKRASELQAAKAGRH